MQYLMIKNPGVAPEEGFTVFGVSTSRYSGNSQTIGQFGSGSKHAVNLLLRNDINPVIYAANLRMEFFTTPLPVKGKNFSQVNVKYSGTDPVTGKNRSASKDLSFTLEHGVFDWFRPVLRTAGIRLQCPRRQPGRNRQLRASGNQDRG